MPVAKVGRFSVYYEIRGNGPRLLSMSGTGGDLSRASTIFDMSIAGHFEILAYDLRGLGRTQGPDAASTMADYAADAAGLLEAVGWQR